MLYISIALLLVLLWYISRQKYFSKCNGHVDDVYYQMHLNNIDVHEQDLSKHQSSCRLDKHISCDCGTMLEKHKKCSLNPEERIMDEHRAGKELEDKLKTKEDPLTLDEIPVVQNETTDQQFKRSLESAENESPQLEGMSAPVDEFEREYMNRQDRKNQEIYGEQAHMPRSADSLSELNM